MALLFYFISLFLGLIIKEHVILSLASFIILLSYVIYTKKVKIYYLIIFYILGVIIYFSSYINLFNKHYVGMIVESKENYFILRVGLAKYYVSLTNNTYEVGDILSINGTLRDYAFKTYESQFDFNLFLKNKYVYKELSINEVKSVFLTPFRIRGIIQNNLNYYSLETKISLGKLLFNLSFDDEYISIISSNALFYLLSISSLHIYLFNGIIKKLLGIKLKEKNSDLIILILNLIFYLLSNYKITILKVLLFSLISYYLNYYSKRRFSAVEKISLVGLIILFTNPSYSLSISFIYSFSIPFYMIFIKDSLIMYRKKNRWIITSIMLFLFIIPIQIYNDGYFSLLSIFLSQFLIIIIFPLFILGLFGLIFPLYFIVDFYGKLIYRCTFIIDKISVNVYYGKNGIKHNH